MTTPQDGKGGCGLLRLTADELEHELRTPLASIRSISEILRDYPDLAEEERRTFLEAVLHEERRLSRIIDRVLASPAITRLVA